MKRVHQAIFLALMMATMSLAGCFGDDDKGSDEDETPVETLDDWQVHFANTASDLPECNDDRNGWLYYISADENFRVCTQFGWELVDITGPSGADGQDGIPGADGADGQDGAPGADGIDGDHGDDGQDGKSILINVVNSTSCLNGGNTFEIGNDDDADGVLNFTEIQVTVDICNGAQGPAGADGTDGADGTNGSASPNTMLTSISPPATSLECYAGGRLIAQGLDNGDGGGTAQNGILESGEIDYTTTFCSTYEIYQVADINSGFGGSFRANWMEILVGNTIYFTADDGSTGDELWAHDTSNQSTWQVADIRSGTRSSYPGSNMQILVGDTIYFNAHGGSGSGHELWAYDTSNHSTWQVEEINSGSSHGNPGTNMEILVGDTIYFNADDGNTGHELWAHDTSNHSTWQVADIYNGSSDGSPGMNMEILVGDTIYFNADDGNTGFELWAHDTSNHSTWQVADINSGVESGFSYWSTDSILVGDTIYFNADDGNTGHELWAHDTSNHSTWQVADIYNGSSDGNPGTYMQILVGDTIYFNADDVSTGRELWAHDTSNHSTWQVADISSGSSSSNPGMNMGILVGDTIYFNAYDGSTGREMWAHDTSKHSTWQVADISSGSSSSNPGTYMQILVGDTIYFNADNGSTGYELWAFETLSMHHIITYD